MNTKLALILILAFSLNFPVLGYAADAETHKTKNYLKRLSHYKQN